MAKPISCPRCEAMLDVELDEENPFVQCSQCQIVFTRVVPTTPVHVGYGLVMPDEFDSQPRTHEPRLTFHRQRGSFTSKMVCAGGVLFFACIVSFIFSQRQSHHTLQVTDIPFIEEGPASYQYYKEVWETAGVRITLEGPESAERMTFEADVDPSYGLSLLHLAPEVREIDLSGTQLADMHLLMLADRTDLRWLHMNDTQVTATGIEHLAPLSELESLNLKNCEITDDALTVIARFENLQELGLSGTKVTDQGLTVLAPLVLLKKLYLGDTLAGDKAAAIWSAPMSLEVINLGNTQVGDKGLQHLCKHRQMTYLNLAGTKVTDEGIHHCGSLKRLEGLNLAETEVTPKGFARLEAMLPRAVIWDENH